jgi:hypothetical protein
MKTCASALSFSFSIHAHVCIECVSASAHVYIPMCVCVCVCDARVQVALERADEALKPLDLLAATLQRQLEACHQQHQGADGDVRSKEEGSTGTASRSETDLRGTREAELREALLECNNNRSLVLLCLQTHKEGGSGASGVSSEDGREGGVAAHGIARKAAVRALELVVSVRGVGVLWGRGGRQEGAILDQ